MSSKHPLTCGSGGWRDPTFITLRYEYFLDAKSQSSNFSIGYNAKKKKKRKKEKEEKKETSKEKYLNCRWISREEEDEK